MIALWARQLWILSHMALEYAAILTLLGHTYKYKYTMYYRQTDIPNLKDQLASAGNHTSEVEIISIIPLCKQLQYDNMTIHSSILKY